MPHNVSAIAPNEEITGVATLPLARVKKILAMDEEINSVAANAAFAVTIATEMFIRYIAEQSYNVVKSEKKDRKTIAYRDVAQAVSRIDNLQFLEDIVPPTVTLGQFKARKAAKEKAAGALQSGQTTLDAHRGRGPAETTSTGPSRHTHDPTESDVSQTEPPSASTPNRNSHQKYVFELYEPQSSRRDASGDVEMT